MGIKGVKVCLTEESRTKYWLALWGTVTEKPLMSWAESMLCPCHNQPSNPKTTREHYSDFMSCVNRNECLEPVWSLLPVRGSKQSLPYTDNQLLTHPKPEGSPCNLFCFVTHNQGVKNLLAPFQNSQIHIQPLLINFCCYQSGSNHSSFSCRVL